MKVICDNCGVEFDRKPSQVLKHNKHYCSRMCKNKDKSSNISSGQFKVKYNHINDEGLLLCTRCLKYKSSDLFFNRSNISHRNNKDYICISCEMRKSKHDYKKSRPYKLIHLNTLSGFLKALIQHTRCRKISVEKGYNIDFNFILELYEKQGGKCAISGEQMTTIHGNGKVSTNVSIDRIDSSGGYTRDNVQLVCTIVNIMKTNLKQEDFINWCIKVINNQK